MLKFIEINPDIRSGVPVLRGTRIPVSQIFMEIADNRTINDIAEDLEIDETFLTNFIKSLSNFVG